jgi:hypothetical protein
VVADRRSVHGVRVVLLGVVALFRPENPLRRRGGIAAGGGLDGGRSEETGTRLERGNRDAIRRGNRDAISIDNNPLLRRKLGRSEQRTQRTCNLAGGQPRTVPALGGSLYCPPITLRRVWIFGARLLATELSGLRGVSFGFRSACPSLPLVDYTGRTPRGYGRDQGGARANPRAAREQRRALVVANRDAQQGPPAGPILRGSYQENSPRASNSARSSRRRGSFIAKTCTVARPTGVRPTMRAPSNSKCSDQVSRLG